jgi:Flp pilus assembly protein TadD
MKSNRLRAVLLTSFSLVVALTLVLTRARAALPAPAPILIDYPSPGSLFPPEITAPTFLWRESSEAATRWRIEIQFADGTPPVQLISPGEKMQIGEIDSSYEGFVPPTLTPEQAAAHTWKPDPPTWALIKAHSVAQPATVAIRGLAEESSAYPISSGEVAIRTSKDPAGAPIFYRDVPLIPVPQGEKGVIRPLPESAVPLIKWRLRYLDEARGKIVMQRPPTCANCHSFSGDGKTLGIDVDGPLNDKGLYGLVPVKRVTTIAKENVIRWSESSVEGSPKRFGFMSQVSPNGRYVVNSIEVPGAHEKRADGRIYQASYPGDYGFGQVFFPTRGVLAWYSHESGKLKPLPGADDPRFVHCGAFWSPDGKYLVFSRAEARDPYPAGQPLSLVANGPNETQIQYDLYRMPFNDGKGGTPERIVGASENGMSNDFPKVSPDGKWIVYVRNKNGLLMRPDSELWMVPAQGGVARRMNCNLSRMNSWHSFSPNGRWMVFSSKSRTLYTQMFLTHIDEDGNDSPAILIEDSTPANRAVNIPEFVNIPKGGLERIDTPATEFYRIFTDAHDIMEKGKFAEAIGLWHKALLLDPGDGKAHYNLAISFTRTGHPAEALPEYRKAAELTPDAIRLAGYAWALALDGKPDQAIATYRSALALAPTNSSIEVQLGTVLLGKGLTSEALDHLNQAVALAPDSAEAHNKLGAGLAKAGQTEEAMAQLQQAVALAPKAPEYRYDLGYAMAQSGNLTEAVAEYRKSLELGSTGAAIESELGVVLFETGDTAEAVEHLGKAVTLAPNSADAHNKLATALAGTGQANESAVHFRRAVALSPESLEYRYNLAHLLIKSGAFAEAIPHAEKAVQLSGGKDVRCLAMLGAAYGNTGHPAEARHALERALNLAEKDNNTDLQKTLRTALERYPQPK